ncbi:MAG: tRNA dihydrouridine synthase DusB [Desulfobulbaceae bacterium]|uniref:tRNA-dihydrouridine synthase n=2 Tax=Desulfofustis glycolicus TaxID=51195 RepID=A0A1M5WVL4_9BACT|nr:tRNA dihydrouridine synthase DusB [Desulfobulbaceae bacterium]SHH91478.1 tRNA-U20-dihydrouridine synthase [Desulfofustis glycolicus DSM 9705]
MSIGNVPLSGRLILAPLAGYSDLPFRLLCRRHGAALCVSEMISSHGIAYDQAATNALLVSYPEERPVSFQLFGADAAIMAAAADRLNDYHPDLIDINMGCPVKKVTKRGGGAALMNDPELAERIISAVVAAADCPVTVKCRIGPDRANINVTEFARMAEDAGAAAITVHGRTWKQGFSGQADWRQIARVKQAVSIPVIGNGDISDYHQAQARLAATGCDAVMIGRAALGNPWVFSPAGRPGSPEGILATARQHMTLIAEHGNTTHLGAIKNHIGRYYKGMPGAARFRAAIYQATDWQALTAILNTVSVPSD